MTKVLLLLLLFTLHLCAKDAFTIDTSYYTTQEDLTLSQIKQIKNFTPSEGKNLGIIEQNVWIKIAIKNNSEEELKRIFKFTFPYMDDITVYKEQIIEKYGRTNNYNTQVHSIDNNVFKVKMKALEKQTIYVKIASSYAIKTHLENFSEEKYLNDLFSKKGIFYFCYGIIFALIFYNFFIWLSIRRKEFLYYILFHISLFAGIISWSGFGFQYLWPEFPTFNYYSYGIIANLVFGFQILYIVYYLDTDLSLPKTTFFLKILSKLFFFFALSSIFVDAVFLYELASVFSTVLLLGITLYLAYTKKSLLAFYIFIAELILISGNFFMALSDFGVIKGSFLTHYFYVWGASTEVILMSFALSFKYNETEKQRTIAEQKRVKTEQMLIDKQNLYCIGENFNNLVHQFRQPLSQINSIVYLIYSSFKSGKLTDTFLDEELNNIEAQTTYLSKTLEYFRNFTSHEKRDEIVVLSDFVEKVETIMEFMLQTHNITLQKEFDKNIRIKTDETQFLQVISVIITNAKDAFIQNSTLNPKIIFKAYKEDNILTLSISNNAGEIDPLIKDKIFEPYFTTKNSSQGSGLGLHIVKLIIEDKLNSSISINTDKEWTSFVMKIKDVLIN